MQKYPLLDLMIVGAQKSYTTSLKAYLGEHPSIVTHPQQEMAYFSDEYEYAAGYKKALTHYYNGMGHLDKKKMMAKNAFLYTSEKAIERLHEYNPNCKLILSLRNPVDRAYSSYLMEYNYVDVEFPFEEIKQVVTTADVNYFPFKLFIDAGNYAKHLKNIYKYFPKEQVKVVLCEEIKEDPVKVCHEIFHWLGVDDKFVPHIKIYNPTMRRGPKIYAKIAVNLLKKSYFLRKYSNLVVPPYYNYKVGDFIKNLNKTHHRYEAMAASTREYLLDYYREMNKELEEITGKKVTVLWSK